MLILRKVLFYVFLLLYLALCPVIVLYSLGYIYAPKSEEGLVKTGLIHLETLPPGASVYLNHELQVDKTPCTLSGLLPGRYRVSVQLKGHHPWVRETEVEAGKASVFDHIMLLKKKIRTSVLIPQSFFRMTPVPDTRYLLLSQTEKAGGLIVFDWKAARFKPLFAAASPFADEKVRKIFYVKGSPAVIVMTDMNNGRFLLCDLKDTGEPPLDVSKLFLKSNPDEILWEGPRPGYLMIRYGERVDRADLVRMATEPSLINQVRGFGMNRGKLYGLRESSLVKLTADARKPEESPVDGGRFLETLFQNGGAYRMDFLDSGILFFLGEKKGDLIANLLPYHFVKEGVIGYRTDDDVKNVLIWTKEEIGFLDLKQRIPSEALFERGPEVNWFFYKGANLGQAYFLYGHSHVIFSDEDRIFILPTSQWEAKPLSVLKTLNQGGFYYCDKTGKLYYLDSNKGFLMVLDVLPEERVIEKMLQEIEKVGSPKKS